VEPLKGSNQGISLIRECDIVPREPCAVKTTDKGWFVASLQRKQVFLDESFAQSDRLWLNTINFPKGGWPGNPVGERSLEILSTKFQMI
jgi:hypothetical protein